MSIRKGFKPGAEVQTTGLYWVHHYQHRTSHLVRVGTLYFPACASCGENVRFEQAPYSTHARQGWLRDDENFSDTAKDIPYGKHLAG